MIYRSRLYSFIKTDNLTDHQVLAMVKKDGYYQSYNPSPQCPPTYLPLRSSSRLHLDLPNQMADVASRLFTLSDNEFLTNFLESQMRFASISAWRGKKFKVECLSVGCFFSSNTHRKKFYQNTIELAPYSFEIIVSHGCSNSNRHHSFVCQCISFFISYP